jgi:hypothetical protein
METCSESKSNACISKAVLNEAGKEARMTSLGVVISSNQ